MNLYIHIPFCLKKCNYCSFISFEKDENALEQYFDALNSEFKYKQGKLKTLYIGGGTPSVVPVEFYRKFYFDFDKDYEFTFEVNPGTVDLAYLQDLKSIGVNRLSIGVQSFDNEILTYLGRIHPAQDAINCVKMAQEAGFENISIDLIYGLPNQTMEIWKETLKTAMLLGIQHISTYGLKIEEGTPFGQNPPQNLPSEDTCADMYLECIDFLGKNGFLHYEISNFSLPEFESQHNINYWKNNPYEAIGAAAHGYSNGIRYENTCNFEEYLKTPLTTAVSNILTKEDILEEGIFLGLRMKEGLDLVEFKARYGIDFEEKYSEPLKKYEDFFVRKDNRIALTTEGFMLSNSILSEFVI